MKSEATLTTRRSLLASVPVLAATTMPVVANAIGTLPVSGDDPIFDLIAEHREAIRGETAAYWVHARAEEITPVDQRSWSYRAGDERPPESCTDAPEWIEAQMIVARACKLSEDAELAVLTTPPVTLAGAVALLDHVGLPCFPDEEGSEGDSTILETAGMRRRDDIKEAAADFLPMIADTLRKLIGQHAALRNL